MWLSTLNTCPANTIGTNTFCLNFITPRAGPHDPNTVINTVMTSKRMLTSQEIKHIVSSITNNPHFTDYYTSQLRDVVVNPEIIPKLIRTLVKKHQECLVQPGENVGIICAQSIGEKFTQRLLNTFHKAGLPIPKVITRVEELLNVSKNLKSIFDTIKP